MISTQVAYDVHDLEAPSWKRASRQPDQGEPMRPCESVLNGGDPYFRRLDALRPENASSRGGRPYWEGLARDVDYDVDDAARFEERYEAALDDAAKKKDGSPRLCGNQPLVWGVPTKLQNSLSRSNRSRFG